MKRSYLFLSILLVLLNVNIAHAYTYKKTKENITLQVTDYAHKPHTQVLHFENPMTAQELLSLGIRPVRIQLQNKSDKKITISRKSCNTPTAGYKRAYKLLKRWHIIRPFLTFAPLVAGLQFTAHYPLKGLDVAEHAASIATKVLSVVGGLYGCMLFTENKTIKTRLKEQILYKKITIEPGAYVVDKIVLLNTKDMNNSVFTFRVFDDAYTKKITRFKIDLERY